MATVRFHRSHGEEPTSSKWREARGWASGLRGLRRTSSIGICRAFASFTFAQPVISPPPAASHRHLGERSVRVTGPGRGGSPDGMEHFGFPEI